jgi:hypothetical protein
MKTEILSLLRKLTRHPHVEIVLRGNSAINSALSLVEKDKVILIPEEGGWIHYQKAPKKLGYKHLEVKCDDAKIDLIDLKRKLTEGECGAFLYQNPGGYFAEEPLKEVYALCHKHGCLVILDASGSIGTEMCDGRYADIIMGSFGEWKLVEAKGGGFISCQDQKIFGELKLELLEDKKQLEIIHSELLKLPTRIKWLTKKRKKVLFDLKRFGVVHPNDPGFVVVVKYSLESEKKQLTDYCQKEKLPFTECPRYIRLNSNAISIEIKQLQN